MGKPKGSSQAAPAMVPLQVILAGGAGMSFEDACAKVFQEFDPPIVCGTYSSVSSQRQATNRELGDASPYRNNQSEHLVANSALQGKRGVNSSNVPGASGYTEGTGFAYSVYDDQSAGTEHKFLTDSARSFDQNATGNPSLRQRLDSSKEWTKDMLLRDDLQRTRSGEKRSRISDKPRKRTQKEREALAEAAAECLSKMGEQQFEKQGVSPDTPTRRGMDAGGTKRTQSPLTDETAF